MTVYSPEMYHSTDVFYCSDVYMILSGVFERFSMFARAAGMLFLVKYRFIWYI